MPWMPLTLRPRGAASAQLPHTAPWRRSQRRRIVGPNDRSRPVAVAPHGEHIHTQAMRSSIGGGAHARGQTRIQRRTDRYPTRDCAGEHTRTIVLVHVIPAGLLLAPQLGPPLGACRIGATASLQKPVLPLDKRGREAAFPACHHCETSISSSLLSFPAEIPTFLRRRWKNKKRRMDPSAILCPPRA